MVMIVVDRWLCRSAKWRQNEIGARLHPSAMTGEVLTFLGVGEVKRGIFVDMTIGTGGHALAILRANPTVSLVGIDKDRDSLKIADERLRNYSDRITLLHGDMRHVSQLLNQIGISKVDGCLIDPGMSLWQVESGRGFSFWEDSPLDMRFDRSSLVTAQTLLEKLSVKELENLFVNAGEKRFHAKRLAEVIRDEIRRVGALTTRQLAELVVKVKGSSSRRIHPATKVFMALRMAVNEETEVLREGIFGASQILKTRGKIVVLTYQSTEDRIVKQVFRELSRFPEGEEKRAVLRILTKKPLLPSQRERAENPRARSCKLRAAERVS